MSIHIGDAVLVHINDESHSQRIGVLEYIGYIDSNNQSKFVGINLVETVENGHNGTINGMQHFSAPPGHGIYVRNENIIRKLNCTEITMKMQQIIILFKKRLRQYIVALSERDEYIEELKSSRRRLKKILNKSKNRSSSNNKLLHTIEELTAPPPISMSELTDECTSYPAGKQKKYKKASEYTKYSDKHSNINSISCEISDTSSYTDTSSENENGPLSDEDMTWCDDGYCSSKKCNASTISISTRSRQSKQNSISNTQRNRVKYKNHKSQSAHNTPHQSPILNEFTSHIKNNQWNMPQAYDANNVYANPHSYHMQQLYDKMLQQQQPNTITATATIQQPIQRTKTVPSFQKLPSFQNLQNTKRRTLCDNKPVPEVRSHKRGKTLKLQNRRSNSVDMRYYVNDEPVNNIKPFRQVNVNNNRWMSQQQQLQQQYHNNSPIEFDQALQHHF